LTARLRRCQKLDSQNALAPGRHQIGTVGEIISESWARSKSVHPGEIIGIRSRPLIYPILFESLLLTVMFICFHVVEHLVIGLKPLPRASQQLAAEDWLEWFVSR
jgi:hypothetical protein